ncbi:MAG: PadR family transcriptional regulator, partial [Pseudonocardiaceae bacterium]
GLRAALARTGDQIDRYTLELHRMGLDTTEREGRWLNELIDHERAHPTPSQPVTTSHDDTEGADHD